MADLRKALDAFYCAIPEKFGSEIPGGKRGTVASAIPLCADDMMWLRGIQAAIDALGRA